jgi:hypothetical protein
MKAQIVVTICILFITILAGCVTQMSKRWQFYDGGPFSFSMPSSFAGDASWHEIDSYARWFTNTEMILSFDYEAYSGYPAEDDIRKYAGYVSRTESIAGHDVQIVSFDGDMHFPEHFNYNIVASFLRCGLTMQVACATKSDYEKALRIFGSVKFKEPNDVRTRVH